MGNGKNNKSSRNVLWRTLLDLLPHLKKLKKKKKIKKKVKGQKKSENIFLWNQIKSKKYWLLVCIAI